MSESQLGKDGIEVPSEVVYVDDGAIIRYSDGRQFKIHGYGSMRDTPLDLDPRIDLTQPIYEQTLNLWHKYERSSQTSDEDA